MHNLPISTLTDKLLFSAIDKLNRTASHTNPENIKQNIRIFLEKTSENFKEILPENSKGIDIGAGYGTLSDILRPRLVYNLDKSPPKNGYGTQIQAEAESLPFRDETFDFALIFYAFNHFNNPTQAFEEANRVIKHGGHIISMVEFLRYKGQDRMIKLNEISMNQIIYNNQNSGSEADNFFTKSDFKKLIDNLTLTHVLEKTYPATRKIDYIFKTSKTLYILQKN